MILIGGHVLVYHSKPDRWEGRFIVLEISSEENTMLLWPPSKPVKFWSTVTQ